MAKHVVIACGGTGGHLFPGIAVAEELRKAGHEALLLISEKEIDKLATEGYGHLRFRTVPSIGMPKLFSPKMISFLWGFFKSALQCRTILKDFGADTVLGMGGFTSTGPLMAGRWAKCRTFIHESNAIPGRANRLNAKFSDVVLLGLKECAAFFPAGKTRVVGTPLRPAILNRPSREEGLAKFGLNPELKTILVMGGSQGARGVNDLFRKAFSMLPQDQVQVLHIAGPQDYEAVKMSFEISGMEGAVLPFCQEIQYAYAASDLAVARSGASSLAELCYFGLPAILIPYPFAADDHQTRNAEIFDRAGACYLWPQNEIQARELADKVIDMLSDQTSLSGFSARMRELAVADSAAQVRKAIEEIEQGK